jgi:putative ABC transport system ATP-binding protein
MDLLEQINEMGTTIVLVTHDPELARRAHRNVHIVDGQVSDLTVHGPRSATDTSGATGTFEARPA